MLTDFAKPITSKATRIDLEKQNARLKSELRTMESYANRLRKQLSAKIKQLKFLENDYSR
tara:strand:+ start:315 stop:494 length:180 start_codon:yes stop_codon:yes gene_type:complete